MLLGTVEPNGHRCSTRIGITLPESPLSSFLIQEECSLGFRSGDLDRIAHRRCRIAKDRPREGRPLLALPSAIPWHSAELSGLGRRRQTGRRFFVSHPADSRNSQRPAMEGTVFLPSLPKFIGRTRWVSPKRHASPLHKNCAPLARSEHQRERPKRGARGLGPTRRNRLRIRLPRQTTLGNRRFTGQSKRKPLEFVSVCLKLIFCLRI